MKTPTTQGSTTSKSKASKKKADTKASKAAVDKAAKEARDKAAKAKADKAAKDKSAKAKADNASSSKPAAKPAAKADDKPANTKEAPVLPTSRQLGNACRGLTTERRAELYAKLYGKQPPKTVTVRAMCAALGGQLLTALKGGTEVPKDVLEHMPKARGGGGPRAERPGIRSLFRELVARQGGVTIKELREEAAKRDIDLKKSKVAATDGRLKSHVVGPAKAMGWDITESTKDKGRFHGKAPKVEKAA